MLTDLKSAFRQLIKNPGFSIFAVLLLALGIGANTAIFDIINAVLLNELPVKNPQELVFLTGPDAHGIDVGGDYGTRDLLTYPEFQYLRENNQVLSGITAVCSQMTHVPIGADGTSSSGEGRPVNVSMVSGSYFSVLGVNAEMGRAFGTEVDAARSANPVAVISYDYWQNKLGRDPAVLGRKIRLRDTSFDIIGVAPRYFSGETVGAVPAIWVPLTMQGEIDPGSDRLSPEKSPLVKTFWLQVIGRLKPGVTLAEAGATFNVSFQQYLKSQLGAGVPGGYQKQFLNQRLVLHPGGSGGSTLRQRSGQPLIILMVLVGLLLLIACANLANLMLARAHFRRREIAVRVALGARPGQIARQLVTESMLLALLGGALGLLVASWGDTLLLQMAGYNLDVHFSRSILLFDFGVSLVVGLLFGLAPAWQIARANLNSALKGAGEVAGAGGRIHLGKALVVSQVALSILLLIVSGLFVHSFLKLAAVDLGFEQDHLLQFSIDPAAAGYKNAAFAPLYQSLSDRIRAIPAVRAVSFAGNGLFTGSDSGTEISIEGYTPTTARNMHAKFTVVGPNYFSTAGIPVLLGRELGPQDAGTGQRFGVINQAMARYYFGDANPLGHRIRNAYNPTHPDFIVVGVVADVKQNSAREEPRPRFYVPFFNPMFGVSDVDFQVRTAGDPAAVADAIRAVVTQIAPKLPTLNLQTVTETVGRTLGLERLLTRLSSLFGVLAALLAGTGIYGIMSHAVARRTREVGIRMALGAQRGNVLWLILNESLLLVLIGVAIGVPASIGAGRLITRLLYGLTPVDPPVLAGAVALMFIVAAVAGYFPAWRATKVNPLVALRAD